MHPPPPPFPHPSGLCLAHLGRPEESDSYLASLLNESPELYGDLYLDVGNAFIAMGRHEKALTFLQRLQVRGKGGKGGGNTFVAMGRHEKALTFLQRLQVRGDRG